MKKFLVLYALAQFIALLSVNSVYGQSQYEIQIDNIKYERNPTMRTAEVIGCATWLKNLTIPSTITYEGDEYAVKSIRSEAFARHDSICEVSINPGMITIGEGAFHDCPKLKTVSLPTGLEDMGKNAFSRCYTLTEFVAGDGPTLIPDNFLAKCHSLTFLSLPTTIQEIGNGAFEGCNKLSVISLPENTEIIGARAFKDCDSLTVTKFPASIQIIRESAFSSTAIKEADFSDISCSLGEYVFENCQELEKVIFPSNLTVIPAGLLSKCSKVNTVVLPESIKKVGDFAFSDCSLTTVTIPANVIEVGESSFVGVQEVYGCEGLQKIGPRAFSGNISYFPFNPALKEIGEQAFSFNQFESVELPEGLERIGECAFSNIYIGFYGQNDEAKWVNSSYYNKTIKYVSIPGGLNSFNRHAFSGLYNLKHVKINQNLGFHDFCHCPNLEKIEFVDYDGESKIGTIIEGLNDCPRLTELTLPGTVRELSTNFSFAHTNIQILRLMHSDQYSGPINIPSYMGLATKNIKYLYIDRPLKKDDYSLNSIKLERIRLIATGDNLKQFNLNEDFIIRGEWLSKEMISYILGKSITAVDKYGPPMRGRNLICYSIFPPEGNGNWYCLENEGQAWVPDESVELYNAAWHSVYKVPFLPESSLRYVESMVIPSTFEVEVNKIAEIPVTFHPDDSTIKNPIWITLNSEVIDTDENGQLVAYKPGVADIYCIAADGTEVKSNLCTVTVSDKVVASGIKIQPDDVKLDKGEHIQLKVIWKADDSEVTDVNWTSSDESVAMVSQTGLLLARNDGKSVVTATLNSNEEVSDAIEVVVGDDSGIDEIMVDKNKYVTIFNMNGVKVYEGEYSKSKLSPGFYILVYDDTNNNVKVKIE